MPSEPKTAGEISVSGRTTMTPFDVQATHAYIRETNTFGPCHTMEPPVKFRFVLHFSLSPPRVAFLAWVDFHARSRFTRSTIPKEQWGTTRSLVFSQHPAWVITPVKPLRGGTWVFFGWVCAARESKLAPRSKRNSPKIDTPF